MNKLDDAMIQKTFRMSCKQGNYMNQMLTFIVTPLVGMIIHCATMCVSSLFEPKISVERDFYKLMGGGGVSIFKHLYLNDCAEVDCK